MSLTCDSYPTSIDGRNASPPHFDRDEEGEAIQAAGLLEIGVARKPRNMVIAWVSHVLV